MIHRVGLSTLVTLLMGGLLLFAAATCSPGEPDGTSADRPPLDTRLEVHSVLEGEPTSAGLQYVRAIADAHRRADRSSDRDTEVEILVAALAIDAPPGDGTAEVLHFELLARTADALLQQDHPETALSLLEHAAGPSMSLPIDRSSARCLVSLGDAAARTGDQALAMGSYTRSLEMLSLLLEEVDS